MILDIFSELQRALPPGQKADAAFEGRILKDAIEQAKLADELGFGCWWTVEHHGATEFSYSSSPEMMLAVLAQHTERIHLGHSGVLAPFNINHPLRVAERAAFLDQVSDGRLELGLARSGGTEWETFEVDPDSSREQLREALAMIPRMWTEDVFEWKSEHVTIPPRNVVPTVDTAACAASVETSSGFAARTFRSQSVSSRPISMVSTAAPVSPPPPIVVVPFCFEELQPIFVLKRA